MKDRKNNPDPVAERLQAQAQILERMASECWSEKAATKIRELAREAVQADRSLPPTLWDDDIE